MKYVFLVVGVIAQAFVVAVVIKWFLMPSTPPEPWEIQLAVVVEAVLWSVVRVPIQPQEDKR